MENSKELSKFLNNSKRDRNWFLLLCFLILFAIIIIMVLSSLTLKSIVKLNLNNFQKQVEICTRKECIEAAFLILENMDTTADPCNDFYQFTCGGYEKARTPYDQNSTNLFEFLHTQLINSIPDLLNEDINKDDINSTIHAKLYYKSCINETAIELNNANELLNVINYELGGWPILNDDNWNQNKTNLVDLLVKLRLFNFQPIFQYHVMPNEYVLSKNVRLSLAKPTVTSYLNHTHIDHEYQSYISKIVQYLNPKIKSENISKEINKIIEFERMFEQIKKIDDSKLHGRKIRSLARGIPEFDWKKYLLDNLLNRFGHNITDEEMIAIEDYSYLNRSTKFIIKYMNDSPKDVINFIIWKFVQEQIDYLPRRFQIAKYQFERFYNESSKTLQRPTKCSNILNDNMALAIGRLYLKKYFNEESLRPIFELIDYIDLVFKNQIKRIEWLDDTLRYLILTKLSGIRRVIAYRQGIHNNSFVDSYYRDHQFKVDEFFTNHLKLAKIGAVREFQNYGKNVDPIETATGPATLNAFFDPVGNEIDIPAGILKPPFYHPKYPSYVNFARIGSVIGHEIAHSLDHDGHFLESVQQNNTLSNKTMIEIRKRVECIRTQYNRFYVKKLKKFLDGNATLTENIADNAGLAQAFRAYQAWTQDNKAESLLPGLNYNQNQLFFINYAQIWCTKWSEKDLTDQNKLSEHSPGEFRINGPVTNLAAFAKTFQCKQGTKHNPAERCIIWN